MQEEALPAQSRHRDLISGLFLSASQNPLVLWTSCIKLLQKKMADVFVELSAASQEPLLGTLVGDASAGRRGGSVVFANAGRLKGRD